MPARLQTEPGPEMVQVLLEPAALLADRRAGQMRPRPLVSSRIPIPAV